MKNIYINGCIYTVTKGVVEAFVVEQGKFIYVGNNEGALALKDDNSTIKDIKGCFITAGFNDSHMHLISTGNLLNMLDLYEVKSKDELVSKGKDYISQKEILKDSWVVGFGWNQDYFSDKEFPNRYDLDKISRDHPICFIRVCYHVYIVNSKALEIMGIDQNTPQIEGGQLDIDEHGEVLGIFREAATELIMSHIAHPDLEQIKNIIENGVNSCNSQGITSIQTDDLSEFTHVSYGTIIKAFEELESQNKLNAKIYQQSRFDKIDSFKEFLAKGYRTGKGSTRFKIGPLKLILDGSLGARTALLNKPYSDQQDNYGIQIWTQEQLNEWIELAQSHDMQIACHAIGDKAMYILLDSYEKSLAQISQKDHRYGIVHVQITDEKIIEKMEMLNLLAYVQTVFIDYDSSIVYDRVGKERAYTSYNFKTMLEKNIKVSNGSDSPVEWPNVFKGMQIAITRAPITDKENLFLSEQAMTVEEAIYSYTMAGAYASFEEKEKGSIEVGKVADFIVLSQNLLEIDPFDIYNTKVLETYLDGQLIWKS